MYTAVYLRVSSDQQDVASQRQSCLQYVHQDLGVEKCAVQMYEDHGISGRTMERAAILSLLDDMQRGNVKRVVVFELSRISRNMADTLAFVQRVRDAGVELHVVTSGGRQSVDTVVDQFVQLTHGLASQLERERISQRTKAGLAAARARGVQLGAPKGHRRNVGRRKEYAPELVNRLRMLRRRQMSLRVIAEVVNMSHATVARILKQAS